MSTLTLDDLRKAASSLPDGTETTHFRLPAFTVRGRAFLVLQQGETHAIVHLGKDEAVARMASPRARPRSCAATAGRSSWASVSTWHASTRRSSPR